MNKKIIFGIIFAVIILQGISAAHYIEGYVENAKDGTFANGHTVAMWNYENVSEDSLTDIVGPSGNSGINNYYKIDCESLNTPCVVGDILTLKIINDGDNYVSSEKNVSVTGAEYDLVSNLSLNSPPNTGLNYPLNHQNISMDQIQFNCSASDLDANLQEIILYGNWTGMWEQNESKQVSGENDSTVFLKSLSEGTYVYSCQAKDNLEINSVITENISFNVDLTPPEISQINVNLSLPCKGENIEIDCFTEDYFTGIKEVFIEANNSIEIIKHTATSNFGKYSSTFELNKSGEWNFKCIARDNSGNEQNLTSETIEIYPLVPEIKVISENISFNNSLPIEKEIVKVTGIVNNLGCSDSLNVVISLFNGNPFLGGINLQNKTINISNISYSEVNFDIQINAGPNNFFIFADSEEIIDEENESNNIGSKILEVTSWQIFYGKINWDKIIGKNNLSLENWNESYFGGNIFVTDKNSQIEWSSLKAIGKTKNNSNSYNDFREIDYSLNMENFSDSNYNMFTNFGIIKNESNFTVYGIELGEVPVIKSANNTNFFTGVLWDCSDDSNDEYDSDEKEDLIFITKINQETQGDYGIYDYEIKIPAKLREYKSAENSDVYFYYDLR